MKNIEIKVRVSNFKEIEKLLKKNGAKAKGILLQKDTYFNCAKGRLKMREINKTEFNFIYYNRPDNLGSKTSNYVVMDLDAKNGRDLARICAEVNGVRAVVIKERQLWIYKHTRIHLDKVRGLGSFVELETVVDDISLAMANKEHLLVIELLGLGKHKSLAESYVDLIMNK